MNNIGNSQIKYENRSATTHDLVTNSFTAFVTSRAKIETETSNISIRIVEQKKNTYPTECRVEMSKNST